MCNLFQLFAILQLIFGLVVCVSFQSCDNVHGKNLTQLSGSWKVYYNNSQVTNQVYLISLCSALTDSGCIGSSICSLSSNSLGQGKSFGVFALPPTISSNSESSVSFYVEYNTTKPCWTNKQGSFTYRSSITFECAKTLGSPEVISSDECSVDFLWETSQACRPSEYDATKEVRCHAYDSNHKKRDLSSLIKRVGGYLITNPSTSSSASSDGVYINVCRDIKTVTGDSMHTKLGNCPPGAAGCLVQGGRAFSLGEPTKTVNITTENRLILKYASKSSDVKPTECGNYTPQVIVTFVCPGTTRGGSKPPIVTSSLNCQYTIEWWTEAACPADFLTSETCGLENERHGVEFDLSPLTKQDSEYTVETGDHDGDKYLINICGGIHATCGESPSGNSQAAVCQISNSNANGFRVGMAKNYRLQYLDGELSITYKNGDRCHSNGLRRTSMIVFHCNESAGMGKPTFNHELHCTYYFDWETSHACLRRPVCHLTDSQGQTFDLSPLSKMEGTDSSNWEALVGGEHSINQPRYFINICNEILRDRVTSACPPGAAVCRLHQSQHTSFGSFSQYNLTRQSNKMVLVYSNGDKCGATTRSTVITFYCRPGDLESSPVLKYLSSDDCELHLVWYTSSACPLKAVSGSKCMVSDEDSGLTFDLRRLTKESGQKMYQVSTGQYDYYLNVCGKLSGTSCDNDGGSPATCQVEKGGLEHHYTTGQVSDILTYYNGFIKLVYADGSAYRDHLHNRTTQISFLCDTKVGPGEPKFISESNHTYLFNWYTSYVCPAASIQCMAVDPNSGEQYDLSSLAKSEDDEDANWSVLVDQESDKVGTKQQAGSKYYLNVCRPVNEVEGSNPTQGGCDALAGACQTTISSDGKEMISVSSLGRPSSAPVVENKGQLLLTYKGGAQCTNDEGQKTNYTTKIHFVCRKGILSSSPRFLSKTKCSVSFLWHTEAACPISSNTGIKDNTECEVTSSNSAYTFNLQPLIKPPNQPYTVETTGKVYELNVCGKVNDCLDETHKNVSGCERTLPGNTYQQRMKSSSGLSYSDDGVLYLSYQSFTRNAKNEFEFYRITFICDRKSVKGQPTLSSIDGNSILFDFHTSLACAPEPVDCLVSDDVGNQYDLSPLSRTSQPWQVVESEKRRKFYLNVCRPLPPIDDCPGSGMGACMVETSPNTKVKGRNLGLVQSNPVAVSNGGNDSTVSITYMGGDVCKADKKRRYSTRIQFQCSHEEGASPVLQPSGDDPCRFLFVWRTPVACPLRKVTGQSCKVTEPLYQINFDLSPLSKSQDYNIPANKEWNFTVNICSALKQAKKGCEGSGSCQVATSGDVTHKSGNPSSKLEYDDGVISLKYSDGQPCHRNKYNRSTTFRFTCNHEDNQDSSNGEPTFINETADCTYVFDWPTALACPPIKIVGCTAQHGLDNFDLSPLSLSNANYRASTRGDTGGRSYYINVCRSLLHRPGVTCPPNSAACVKNGKKYTSLGELTSGPEFNGNTLRLVYTNGAQCSVDRSRNYTTTITFQCDARAAVDTLPVVIATEQETCDVQVMWVSRAACALGSHKQPDAGNSKPCTAVNPSTGHVFNLSSLASATFYEISSKDGDGRYFHINICKKIVGQNCPDGTGSCMAKLRNGPYTSAGKASSNLAYTSGALSLQYSDGDVCPANSKYKQTTTVSFVCHRSSAPHLQLPSKPSNLPEYVGEDKETCNYYFAWHTHLACEIQQSCAVVKMGGLVPHIIDMSTLIPDTGHYIAVSDVTGNSSVYFINICRPLEPMHGVNCPPGAAVCEATKGKSPKSLGYIDPNKRMISINNDTVMLEYPGAQPCETNRGVNVSSKILFTCERSVGKGTPRLVDVTSDCVYIFEWGTAVVCDEGLSPKPKPSSGCVYRDTINKIEYDLSKVQDAKVTTSTGSYDLALCSSVKNGGVKCRDSAVCFSDGAGAKTSLGKLSTQKISSSATKQVPVQVEFAGGDKCPYSSENRKVSILLRCDRNSENGPPTVVEDKNRCHYIVYWPTPHVCPPPEKSCLATDANGRTYDLSLLSSITHYWSFFDGDGNKYYLNLCRAVPNKQCSANATVCRRNKATKKIENLSVLSTQSITASNDVITVRYSQGQSGLCKDKSLRSSVEVKFICDKAINSKPKFISVTQSDCVVHVEWKTRIACADQPEKVKIGSNGKITDPKSGAIIDISFLLSKTWETNGDLRQDSSGPSQYRYLISLRGEIEKGRCAKGTTVCQEKVQDTFTRGIGDLKPAPTYVMTDESLEMTFSSNDQCGKDMGKKSHSILSFYCSKYGGWGNPVFVYESNECGYFFEWYTEAMCVQVESLPQNSTQSQTNVHEVAERHGHAVAVVSIVFTTLAVLCVLVLIFHKGSRRKAFGRRMKRAFGCGDGTASYRYIRSGDDDEGTSLFEDDELELHQETSLLGSPKRLHGSTTNRTTNVPLSSIDGAAGDDIFGIPEVDVVTSHKPKPKGKKRKSPKQSAEPSNPFEDSDSDDLLPFLKDKGKGPPSSRAPGVGRESKVVSYHDEEDEDLLEG